MRGKFRKIWDDMSLKAESLYRKYSYIKKAKIRLKRMHGGFNCDKEYKEIVVPYWKKYGYKPAKFWYQLFSDREKKVDPRYIPDDLYYGELIPYFCNSSFRRFGEDKCYHYLWIKNIKRPKTVCKNIAGVYYTGDDIPSCREDAVKAILSSDTDLILKPSIDSGEGRCIHFLSKGSLDNQSLECLLDEMKANYIAQEIVIQHPDLAKFNPTSVNTIRVVTFLLDNNVYVLSTILRIGALNSKVDNIGAGGFACPIKKDGRLSDKAVNRKAEWVEANDAGIKFADNCIPEFDKVVELVKNAHKMLPHFKIIGWDMTVDTDNQPIVIEFNTCPGSNQITCGPTFGDLTDKVLEEYFITRTLEYAQN
ncbi:MAG: hypothetical protein J5706_06380 [Elusimicrobiales bacterium]|nr:hypothetical protein [Elusimicrobiales bacterium]